MSVRRLINFAASPRLMHYTLPVLMIYLVAGTIAQKYIGLYQASRLFFDAPVVWLGFVPLPGVPILLVIITLNLTAKLMFKSPWRLAQAGNIITHVGVLLLFVGGGLTALLSNEGYLDLGPGMKKDYVADYHKREVVLLDHNNQVAWRHLHRDLEEGEVLALPFSDTSMKVLETCRHCKIAARGNADETYQGMAEHMQLETGELKRQDEENLSGLTFRMKDEVHTILENVPRPAVFTFDEQDYQVMLRRVRRPLPFQVELISFNKEFYPGTQLARSYSSEVRVTDGPAQWISTISMNKPLRYKGHTLYQSSFIPTSGGDISVLSVVENSGRIFPYLSGIITCLGILLHLFMRRYARV